MKRVILLLLICTVGFIIFASPEKWNPWISWLFRFSMTRTNPALYTEEITIKRFIPLSTYRFRCNICDCSKNMITERRKRYKPENNREIKSHVYGKHQGWDSSWEFLTTEVMFTANTKDEIQVENFSQQKISSFYRKNRGETTFVFMQ